jgi:hypothetical protein
MPFLNIGRKIDFSQTVTLKRGQGNLVGISKKLIFINTIRYNFKEKGETFAQKI